MSLAAALSCHFVLAGCRAAPDAATADVTVVYRGQQLSGSRIAARLGQEAQVDTLTEDGHSAAVKLVIEREGDGNYRTAVEVQRDGAVVGATDFLSAPGQPVASEGADLQIALRVSPGA